MGRVLQRHRHGSFEIGFRGFARNYISFQTKQTGLPCPQDSFSTPHRCPHKFRGKSFCHPCLFTPFWALFRKILYIFIVCFGSYQVDIKLFFDKILTKNSPCQHDPPSFSPPRRGILWVFCPCPGLRRGRTTQQAMAQHAMKGGRWILLCVSWYIWTIRIVMPLWSKSSPSGPNSPVPILRSLPGNGNNHRSPPSFSGTWMPRTASFSPLPSRGPMRCFCAPTLHKLPFPATRFTPPAFSASP